MILEEFRELILEVDDERLFVEKSLEEDNVKLIVKKVRWLLYRRLKVGVEDGCIFVGKFYCLDK